MSGRRPAPSLQAAALEQLLQGLGFRAMAVQAGAETDPEKLQLYAQIAMRKAPGERKAAIRQRLESLQLL